MIEFFVIGQTIRYATPTIAADSLNYLEASFDFANNKWDGYSKWAHFRKGDTLYDIALENDRITKDMHLNLTQGEWEIYLTGTKDESRLTTVPVIVTVYESGLIDGPLHEIPMTVAEQVDAKASTALLMAQAVKDMADRGEFDGESLAIEDYFLSVDELWEKGRRERNVLYGVGTEPPLDIYGWSEEQQTWVSNGSIQGAKGETGEDGATFAPTVDASGNLSWSNDGGRENPPTVNIRGPEGKPGEKGEDGKGPYEYAQEGGYTGTEATFLAAMTQFPYHNQRHRADGADPLSVNGEMIEDGAVSQNFPAYVPADGWTGDAAPYTNTVAVAGITADDTPIWDILCSEDMETVEKELEAYALVYRMTTAYNSVTFYAIEKPEVPLNIQLKAVRK